MRLRFAVWIAVALVALTLSIMTRSPIVAIGAGAIVGGAAGNLIDGVRRCGVVDFIDVHVWPVFNLADVAIVAGTTLTVSGLLGW